MILRPAQLIWSAPKWPFLNKFVRISGHNRFIFTSMALCKDFPFHKLTPVLKIKDAEDAHGLVKFLQVSERKLLQSALNDWSSEELQPEPTLQISPAQSKAIFLYCSVPFVGFGILDNLLMIMAGEYIDLTLGVTLGISTMAAAGLGNIISDLAGIGTAHYVESLSSKLGIHLPDISAEQWKSAKVRWIANIGRAVGLVIGCFIGMFPLLFFDEEKKKQLKNIEKDG